ncbi:MAG: 50S ribosomal protein L18a [Candidatus Thorarchaeota archaeon]|nr:50S ribosomal protein L18a [Candidatus Thorarchaeota archaeon]
MSAKVWRVSGEYFKLKRKFAFSKELVSMNKERARERVLSELGSQHRVKRRDIRIKDIKEIKPEEAHSLELRRLLGVESTQ